MKIRNAVLALSAAAALATSLGTTSAAVAANSFDGAWSVLIVTDSGDCDRAYRYALHITNGKISYDDPSFNVSGHVDPRGHVNVTISAGGQCASGSGRLSGDSGQGHWIGRSSTSSCSGHWQADTARVSFVRLCSNLISEKCPSGGIGRRSMTLTPPWRAAHCASRSQRNSTCQPSRRPSGANSRS